MRNIALSWLAGVALLAGCAPNLNIVGKWKVDTAKTNMGLNSKDPAAQAGEQMAKAMLTMFTIEFKPDGKVSMIGGFLGGDYKVNGHTVTMHMTSAMGIQGNNSQQQNQDVTATISDDGNNITMTAPPGQANTSPDAKLVFVRDKS